MKMKYYKRIIGITSLVIVVFVYVVFMQLFITNIDQAEFRSFRSYYLEEPDSLDVVILGASEIVHGYSAVEAYKTAGFTSYPYAFSINSVLLWKYELDEIEKTQHPKLLVIETNGALYSKDSYLYDDYCTNIFTEGIPMSANRIKAAFDMSDKPAERLFPFIRYHYKWKNIRKFPSNTNLMLFRQGHAKLRGEDGFTYRSDYSTDNLYPLDGSKAPILDKAETALYDFLKQCKESSIEKIIFIEYPHITNSENRYARQQRANYAADIIRAEGFDYIDLNSRSDEIGLDIHTDYHDSDHLLASGKIKTTQYLARLIHDKYLNDYKNQSEKNASEWNESVELVEKYYILHDEYLHLGKDNPKTPPRFFENKKTLQNLQ